MPVVWIPSLLRDLTGGQQSASVPGSDVQQVIESLDEIYPGIKARLCDGSQLRPGIAIVVDTEVARLGLRQPVTETSEVHFIAAVSGG